MGLYVLYDSLAKQSGPVFMARSNETALRQFEVQKPDIPEAVRRDLRLYKIAEMDMVTMVLSEVQPQIIDESVVLYEQPEVN